MSEEIRQPGGRCAVVYNPTKISEQFRYLVEKVVQRDGWVDTLWLETSVDDPGRAMTPFSFPSPAEGVWHLGPVPLRAYALCIIAGIVLAVWLGERRWVATEPVLETPDKGHG